MEPVSVYYLEMRTREALRPGSPVAGLQLMEARIKQFALNRFLYVEVGDKWRWHDRLSWSEQRWRDYAEADNLRTWVAYVEGSPAGYFELQRQANNEVEICSFGLTPSFIGKGLGGHFLTLAIEQAWLWEGTQRVLLNTCSLDHPAALANYRARGMQVYRTVIEKE